MIEFIVGMVAVMTVTVGILQMVSLMLAYNRVRVDARREAGQRALLQAPPVSTPSFIQDWQAGNDGADYSADDRAVLSSGAGTFAAVVVDQASDTGDGWTSIGMSQSDRLTPLRAGVGTAFQLGLVSGYRQETVPLMSAVQSLLFNASSIRVESEVYMAWCDGIY
jgi:hypothetical protein